jgi:hypothetical protein
MGEAKYVARLERKGNVYSVWLDMPGERNHLKDLDGNGRKII